MSIAIKPTAANQVRALLQKEPWLTAQEVHEVTGIPMKNVTAAMQTKGFDKPKSRAASTSR